MTLLPGSETTQIGVVGSASAVSSNGALIRRTSGTGTNAALQLSEGATAELRSSRIESTNNGVYTVGLPNVPGSTLRLIDSEVSAVRSGIQANGGADVLIDGSRVFASGSSGASFFGVGLASVSADTVITNGSYVGGQVNGIWLMLDATAPGGGAILAKSSVTVDGSTVEGLTGPAILIRAAAGQRLDGKVMLVNGATLRGGNGNIIEVRESPGTGSGHTVADIIIDDSHLTGNIFIENASEASLRLSNNAILNGIITGPADTTVTKGASWNLTGDSSIGDLTLGSGGTVKLGDGTAFNTLNVNGDFVGQGGTFAFNTVFGDDSSPSDKVVIAGNSSGTGNIVVNNINGSGAQTGEGIQLISVAGSSDASFVMPGRATAGIYEYLLYKGGVANPNDGAWYLRSTYTGDPCDLNPSLPICAPTDPGTPVDPVAPVIPVDPIDPGGPTDPVPLLRPEPGAYLANQAAAVHMFQQRRHDRGEPAFEHDGAGAWARVGRDQMHTTIAGQVDTRTHTNVLQIGSDLYRWGQSGRGQIGLMLATGEAETQATSRITGYGTRGKVKGDAVGLYGTWVQSAEDSSGLYVDGWLQYGRYDNRVQGNNLPRETYDATTRAASVEAGYGWAFANSDRGTWYLQPQAQLTYTDYKGDTLQEVNGTVVEDDRAGGFESRVGVRLFGHDNASGNRVQPFLAVNWLYTERGDAMRFDGERLDARLPTNRYEAQAGAQLRLGQRWSAWGDLRVQRGDSGYKDAGAQLGLRRAW